MSTASGLGGAASVQPSWLGPQANSLKESAPAFGVGSAERGGSAAAARSVTLSPGPIYLPSARGRMGDGPKFSIGGATTGVDARRAGAAPGPGEYEVGGNVGQTHAASCSATSPRYSWGTGGRHKAAIGSRPVSQSCGEFYETCESIGPQVLAGKRTVSAFAFSHAQRFDQGNRASNPGAYNPGPGAYKAVDASGVQVNSTLRSQPMYGFSRADRFRRPGPTSAGAAPVVVRPSIGPQVACLHGATPASAPRVQHTMSTPRTYPTRLILAGLVATEEQASVRVRLSTPLSR